MPVVIELRVVALSGLKSAAHGNDGDALRVALLAHGPEMESR
jgi:hypothetical protein